MGVLDSLNLEIAILEEVNSSYSHDELKAFSSFDAFFDEVIVQNAYEQNNWKQKENMYRPIYKRSYESLLRLKERKVLL